MTGSLDRDALLARLRDDPPGHLRALHERGDAGAADLPRNILGALHEIIHREPEPFVFGAFAKNLWRFLGSRYNHTYAKDTHHELITAAVWWLVAAEFERDEPTTWEGGQRTGWNEVRGDLIVEGDLELVGAQLFVSGDVRVSGSFTSNATSMVVTGGSLRATHTLLKRGPLFAGDRVEAPLIAFLNQQRGLQLMGGACAVVFDEDRCPGWSPTAPDASLLRTDRMVFGQNLEASRDDFDTLQSHTTHADIDEDTNALVRATLHQMLLWSCDIAHDVPLGLHASWLWNDLWGHLFMSDQPLADLVTPNAMEVFRNQCNGMTR